MMKYGYAWEKLLVTVQTLAASSAPIQMRLAFAWTGSGVRLSYGGPYLPAELQGEYDAIHSALTAITDPAEGSINASCAAMSDDVAAALVERIVSLYTSVCRAHYQSGG